MSDFKDKSRKMARQVFWNEHDRDSYQCPDCERYEHELRNSFEVHHKGGHAMDNRPENLIALCRPCHNLREGKKPSIADIKHLRDSVYNHKSETGSECNIDPPISVYTAGAMRYSNAEDSTWRSSVDGLQTSAVELISPKEIHHDHGGDLVAGIAAMDIQGIDESDAIIAYFDKDEQVGTITELLYAVSSDKPALVLFDENLVDGPSSKEIREDAAAQSEIEDGIGMRYECPVYWFLINSLIGSPNNWNGGWSSDEDWDGIGGDVEVRVVCNEDSIKPAFQDWISQWVHVGSSREVQPFSHDDAARESIQDNTSTTSGKLNENCPVCNDYLDLTDIFEGASDTDSLCRTHGRKFAITLSESSDKAIERFKY